MHSCFINVCYYSMLNPKCFPPHIPSVVHELNKAMGVDGVEYYCSKLDSYPTLSSHWLPLFCSSVLRLCSHHLEATDLYFNLSLSPLIFIGISLFLPSSEDGHFHSLITILFFLHPHPHLPPTHPVFLSLLPILVPPPVWSWNCNLNKLTDTWWILC